MVVERDLIRIIYSNYSYVFRGWLSEIAERMQVTPSWTSKLLSAALRSLRGMLESQGGRDALGLGP